MKTKKTVSPRTRAHNAAHERFHASIEAFAARNRGLDLPALEQTINSRQALMIKHVSPLDVVMVCEGLGQNHPELREMIASLQRSAGNQKLVMIDLLMVLGATFITLAEARAARGDINGLATEAEQD